MSLFLVFIIFVAIYIFIKLYSIFGNDKYDINNMRDNNNDSETKIKIATEALINSSLHNDKNALTILQPVQIVDPKLSGELLRLKEIIPDFVPEVFLKNAEKTFDNVFDAFINGKHQILKESLEENLYNSFANQIKRREEQNLRQEINIIHKQTILSDIIVSYESIQLLVVMDVRQMAAMVDINGQSIDNPNRIYRDVRHKWVFATSILLDNNSQGDNNTNKWIIKQTSSSEI